MEPGQSRQGFLPRLEATFLSIFHPVDGPKVLFQMPEYTFQDAPSASATPDTLPTQRQKLMLDFISMSDYVIPKGPLCGRLIKWVVSSNASVNGRRRSYKVLGHPVLLDGSEKYERNHFIFNLCFVFTADSDVRPYEPIVRKCARLLRQLEIEESFISRMDNLPRLYGIVEQLYEDLNAYYESFIALPEAVSASIDGLEAVKAKRRASGNLTLVDPQELDTLISQASGPLAEARKNKLGSRHNSIKLPQEIQALTAIHTVAGDSDATLKQSTDEDVMASHTSRTAQSSHSPQLSSESRRSRDKSPQRGMGLPHGLGRTVRDAINLKLFPTLPNPQPVSDWDVPVLLIDLRKFVTPGWDLTLVKLIPYMDGVNHIKRIAQLSDTDLTLVRQTVEHLLYYYIAIIIDIFQFSNIYAVKPQIARLLDETNMGTECATYVAKPGQAPLAVPILWRMYSMLRHGRTLHEWVGTLGHHAHCVDVRRFITFGVIKGFIRRVHQYPIFSPYEPNTETPTDVEGLGLSSSVGGPAFETPASTSAHGRSSFFSTMFGISNITTESPGEADPGYTPTTPTFMARGKESRSYFRLPLRPLLRRPTATAVDVGTMAQNASIELSKEEAAGPSRGMPRTQSTNSVREKRVPADLADMLDGTHCDDALCVHFGMCWPDLYKMILQLAQPELCSAATDESLPRHPSEHRCHHGVPSVSGIFRMQSNDSDGMERVHRSASVSPRRPQAGGHVAIVAI